MNKKLLLAIAIILSSVLTTNFATAQGTAINTAGTAADASAILDVNSNSQGMLIPRMSNASMLGITTAHPTAPAGLLVYQTDGTPGFMYWNGSTWTSLSGSAPASAGTIIPFSSSSFADLTTDVTGFPSTLTALGTGSSRDITLTGGAINGSIGQAFSMPRDGTITSISAYYSNINSYTLIGATITITAQLYTSPTPNDIFTPVPGAIVTLAPGFTGIGGIGNDANGITTGLNIPLTAQTRCVLVFSMSATGLSLSNSFQGYVGGGMNIQ